MRCDSMSRAQRSSETPTRHALPSESNFVTQVTKQYDRISIGKREANEGPRKYPTFRPRRAGMNKMHELGTGTRLSRSKIEALRHLATGLQCLGVLIVPYLLLT